MLCPLYGGKMVKKFYPWILLSPAILAILIFLGYPIVENIRLSFLDYSMYRPDQVEWNNFANYIKLFKDPYFIKVTLNTVVWCVAVVGGQFVLGLSLAVLLNRKFRFRGVYQAIVFLPWAIANFLVGLMFRWIFAEHAGLLNYFLTSIGLIDKPISWLADKRFVMVGPIVGMIWYGIPFFGMMVLAALQSIPTEIYESADIDGASHFQRFRMVIMPYIRPTIITTVLLRVIWVFNSPDVIFMMTEGGPDNASNILPLYVYNQAFSSLDFGYSAAVSVFIVVVLLVFALLYLKVAKYNED